MDRTRAFRLVPFGALSVAIHAAIWGAVEKESARAPAAPSFDLASQTLAGVTLDVEETALAPLAPAESPRDPSAAAPDDPSPALHHATATRVEGITPRPESAASHSPAAAAPPALFGALGVRYASDLATSFTRALPQTGSADRLWERAAFGSAGGAEVTLTLDRSGRLRAATVAGTPSPALRRTLDRTLALLGPRTFTARAAVTRLRVSARVAPDDVHDGLHGDVFALSGGSFGGAVGTAFFALPRTTRGEGRRIDLRVEILGP